ATVGFTKLSDVTHRSAKSLMRMLGPRGNPQARNLFEIVAYLQQAEGVRFEVRSAHAALRAKRRPSSRGTKRAASAALRHRSSGARSRLRKLQQPSCAIRTT